MTTTNRIPRSQKVENPPRTTPSRRHVSILVALACITLVAACGSNDGSEGDTDDGSGRSPSAEPVVSGQGCESGHLDVEAVSLGLGPFSVTYNLETGEIDVSAAVRFFQLGPVSVSAIESLSQQSGCFTVEFVDQDANERYILAIDHEGQEVLVHGAGTITQVVTRSRLLIDVTEMCEIHVYSGDQDRPVLEESCSGLEEAFWVAQFGAFQEAGNPQRRVADLEALGVTDLDVYASSTWASACPGHMVVWSQRFATREEALAYTTTLPDQLPEKPWVRRVSNSVADRDRCTE